MFETLISIIPTVVELLHKVFKKKPKVGGCITHCWGCHKIVHCEGEKKDAFMLEIFDHTGVTVISRQYYCGACMVKMGRGKNKE